MTRAVDAPFTWRGLLFLPEPTLPGFWRAAPAQLGDGRTADWKVQRAGSSWYARLRVGADRFPGRGPDPGTALDSAAAEALVVAGFIQQLLPASVIPRVAPVPPRRKTALCNGGEALGGKRVRARGQSRKGAR